MERSEGGAPDPHTTHFHREEQFRHHPNTTFQRLPVLDFLSL